jgi:membrane protease YdiL (CAAX protease family)
MVLSSLIFAVLHFAALNQKDVSACVPTNNLHVLESL